MSIYPIVIHSLPLLQGATKILPNNFVFSSSFLLFVCFVLQIKSAMGADISSVYSSKLTLMTKSTGTTYERTNISYLWKKSNLKHLLQRKYKYNIVEDNYSIIVDPANPCWFVHVWSSFINLWYPPTVICIASSGVSVNEYID